MVRHGARGMNVVVSWCGLVFAALWVGGSVGVCAGRCWMDGALAGPSLRSAKAWHVVLQGRPLQAPAFDFLRGGCAPWSRHWAIRRSRLVFAAAALRALTWP